MKTLTSEAWRRTMRTKAPSEGTYRAALAVHETVLAVNAPKPDPVRVKMLSFRCTLAEERQARALADFLGLSVSEMMRTALADYAPAEWGDNGAAKV